MVIAAHDCCLWRAQAAGLQACSSPMTSATSRWLIRSEADGARMVIEAAMSGTPSSSARYRNRDLIAHQLAAFVDSAAWPSLMLFS